MEAAGIERLLLPFLGDVFAEIPIYDGPLPLNVSSI
jgi:hypothetical protein